MRETRVLKPTNDDWYPCYPENLVKLSYLGELSDGTFRVCAWGADDFGLERDFEKESDAIAMFKRLEKYPLINISDLKQLNFIHV